MTRSDTTTTTKANYHHYILRPLVVLVGLAVAMSLVIEQAGPAQAAFPGANGKKIVFETIRKSNYDIYTMNASDGSGQKRLTRNAAGDALPAWSPNGKKITFSGIRDSTNYEIFVISPNGENQKRLTTNSATDFLPDWQPLTN